jgi:hypothetical protein
MHVKLRVHSCSATLELDRDLVNDVLYSAALLIMYLHCIYTHHSPSKSIESSLLAPSSNRFCSISSSQIRILPSKISHPSIRTPLTRQRLLNSTIGRTCVMAVHPLNSRTCKLGVYRSISGIDAFVRREQLFRLSRSMR